MSVLCSVRRASWFRGGDIEQTLSRELYERLSQEGQRVCRHIVVPKGAAAPPPADWSIGALRPSTSKYTAHDGHEVPRL